MVPQPLVKRFGYFILYNLYHMTHMILFTDLEYTNIEEMQAVIGMRAKLRICMLDYDEESCLKALFNHSYFWNK